MSGSRQFEIAISADMFDEQGRPRFRDYGRDLLDQDSAVLVRPLTVHENEVSPEHLVAANSLISLAPRISARTLSNPSALLAIHRIGVGYDMVDVPACTKADVLLTITKGAVDRPVAEATVGWMIALTHHFRAKDRLVREGGWNDRTNFMGTELRDHTLGIVGFGGIAKALVALLSSFGMNRPLVFDPYIDRHSAAAANIQKVELDQLMAEADFVSVNCPLNQETRGLIGARELALMKPSAYLINAARGGIVDEDSLFEVLSQGRIAGAAIDCFENEPLTAPHRFGTLDNVILAPHSICWTHELFRDMGRMACQTALDLAHGKLPHGTINTELLERKSFRDKWERLRVA